MRAILITLGFCALVGFAYYLATDGEEGLGGALYDSKTVRRDYERPPSRARASETRARSEPASEEEEEVGRALFRLREKLAAGKRVEFPPGTVSRKGASFLLVEKEKSWPEAHEFAAAHGAHLACLPGAEMRGWLAQQFECERPLWLGGGSSSRGGWQWIDGAAWNDGDAIESTGESARRLSLSPAGKLVPADPSQEHYFLLQWQNDGSTPATLSAQLKRTAESAKTNDHEGIPYPFDAISWRGSHYLFLERKLSWNEARKFALSLGGYLAVPASREEHEWIRDTFGAVLGRKNALWLGGYRLKPGERWQWLTQEAWSSAGWRDREPVKRPAFGRMALYRGNETETAGWISDSGEEGNAQGFLVEWSAPRSPVPVPAFELDAWLTVVHRKIRDRVEPDLEEFERERSKLVQGYLRTMKRLVRRAQDDGGRRGALGEIERMIAAAEEANEMISGLPDNAPNVLRDPHAKAKAELARLEDTYDRKLKAHLEFYLEGMGKKADNLRSTGYLDAGSDLQALATSVRKGDNAALVAALFKGTPHAVLPWDPRGRDVDADADVEEEQKEN